MLVFSLLKQPHESKFSSMKKLTLILCIYCLLNPTEINAQKHDYLWLFGYSSNTIDSTFGGTNIDFNLSPPDIYYTWRDMDICSYNASICDAEGNLLFYTNGCDIHGANQFLMSGGSGINPGETHDDWCNSYGGLPNSGDAVALPTSNENIYYLLHKDLLKFTYNEPPYQDVYPFNLYYSKIDISQNAVIEKNVIIWQDTLVSADLTAVKHANNEDWWFFVHKRDTNLYYKFFLQADTILGPYHQSIGAPIYNTGSAGGQAVFSPDGTSYVYYDPDTDIMIHDFDRETGLLSNYRHISLVDSAFVLFGGVAISPNSRFLYVSNLWDAYQFDLWANDIASSRVHIGHFDGFTDPLLPVNLYRMQLGPDCKIYMNSTNTVSYLSVIHYPDRKGLACDLELHGIALPTRHRASIPPFPNYRLGTGEVCDSTISMTSGVFPVQVPIEVLEVMPNPSNDQVKVLLPYLVERGKLLLFDFNGRVMAEQNISLQDKLSLEVSHLPAGVYFGEVTVPGKGRYYFKVTVAH